MSDEEIPRIHGHEVEIRDKHSDTIKGIVRGWEDSETNFKDIRRALDKDPNQKIRMGDVVVEKDGDKFVIRKSSSSR